MTRFRPSGGPIIVKRNPRPKWAGGFRLFLRNRSGYGAVPVQDAAVAAAAVLLCRLASRWLILYGRRRFAFLILLTFLLSWALSACRLLPFSVIGVLMPGILAREIDRQGFRDALLAIAAATLLTALVLLAIGQKLPGV